MSGKPNESFVSVGIHGKASAEHWTNQYGEQIVIVRFGGDVSVHLPFAQAVALQADLCEALAAFFPQVSMKAVR
ncbi:hypothetical protein ACFRAQ_24475 [Nocardia sp. NPDC056611]|uniref:hypothetical protein n=1 Tax=Nocardia sp. NPDC056611 TaxID=3345877 RepID=UPI0036719F06